MNINTRLFGEIGVNEEKIINFPDGIVGFPFMKQFLLINDTEKENSKISWLQSIEEPQFAMPVIDPLLIKEDYNPVVEDELFGTIGELKEDNVFVLVTMSVPHDIEKMSVNLMAPIVINTESMKAAQIIIDEEGYNIKYPIYDILKNKKGGN